MGVILDVFQRRGGHVEASNVYKAYVSSLQVCRVLLCAPSMALSKAGPVLCVVGVMCAGYCSHNTMQVWQMVGCVAVRGVLHYLASCILLMHSQHVVLLTLGCSAAVSYR